MPLANWLVLASKKGRIDSGSIAGVTDTMTYITDKKMITAKMADVLARASNPNVAA